MIRQQDLLLNYLVFLLFSLLSLFPATFNVFTGKIRIHTSGWRRWLFNFWVANFFAFAIWTTGRLLQAIMLNQFVQFLHIPLHIICTTVYLTMSVWVIALFIQNPKLNEGIFNQLRICDEENKVPRRKYTIQEIFILLKAPLLFLSATSMVPIVYLADPTSLQFIYSALPPNLQESDALFAFLVFYESWNFSYGSCILFYGDYVQLAFIQGTIEELDAKMVLLQDSATHFGFGRKKKMVEEWCGFMRAMELKLKLFNHVYLYMVYAVRVLFMTTATTHLYFGITLLWTFPSGASSNLYCAAFCLCNYTILYDKAYQIPEKMDRLKTEMMLINQRQIMKENRDYVSKRIVSVPLVGIQVGGFHILERMATPSYLDFITQQVTSLLIATT